MIDKSIMMLCHKITKEEVSEFLRTHNDWLANTKWDGERIMLIKENGKTILMNRRGKICNHHFPEVVKEAEKLPDCIIDGEVISEDDDFTKLQSRALTKVATEELMARIPVVFMAFDILKYKGEVVKDKILYRRVEHLSDCLRKAMRYIKMTEYKTVKELEPKARKADKEGLILKDMTAAYESRRSKAWLKYKFWSEAEIEVVKYEINNAGIRLEDANGNHIQCTGAQHAPVKKLIDETGKAKVCIQFLERTPDGKYRFPSFRGLVEEHS